MTFYIFGYTGEVRIEADSDDAAEAKRDTMAPDEILAHLDCDLIDTITPDEVRRQREEDALWLAVNEKLARRWAAQTVAKDIDEQ